MTRHKRQHPTNPLPESKKLALQMAEQRDEWASEAENRDQHGSAREFSLTAELLRFYADRIK